VAAGSPSPAGRPTPEKPKRPSSKVRPGDWVSVKAQVVDAGPCHPDDISVELFSHNEQYTTVIRRDRVEQIAPPTDLAYRCTSLMKVPAWHDAYLRCRLHSGHADVHEAVDAAGARWSWGNDTTDAYAEDRSSVMVGKGS